MAINDNRLEISSPECGELIQKSSEWNKNLMKSADIAVFRTKAEAEKNFKFISTDEIKRKIKGLCDG